MPTNLTEKRKDGHAVLSEANGSRSREQETLLMGENLEAGAILGKITASSKLKLRDPASVDGSEVAYGILWNKTDATDADAQVTIIARDAEVAQDDLTYHDGATTGEKATAVAELADLGIIGRATGVLG